MFNQIIFYQYSKMAINGGDTLADQLSNALALKTRISFYY